MSSTSSNSPDPFVPESNPVFLTPNDSSVVPSTEQRVEKSISQIESLANSDPETGDSSEVLQANRISKVIIQIPCYNESETLGITLDALPKQLRDVDTVEWLIIDDGSVE